jgi:hypothetical protein
MWTNLIRINSFLNIHYAEEIWNIIWWRFTQTGIVRPNL